MKRAHLFIYLHPSHCAFIYLCVVWVNLIPGPWWWTLEKLVSYLRWLVTDITRAHTHLSRLCFFPLFFFFSLRVGEELPNLWRERRKERRACRDCRASASIAAEFSFQRVSVSAFLLTSSKENGRRDNDLLITPHPVPTAATSDDSFATFTPNNEHSKSQNYSVITLQVQHRKEKGGGAGGGVQPLHRWKLFSLTDSFDGQISSSSFSLDEGMESCLISFSLWISRRKQEEEGDQDCEKDTLIHKWLLL